MVKGLLAQIFALKLERKQNSVNIEKKMFFIILYNGRTEQKKD